MKCPHCGGDVSCLDWIEELSNIKIPPKSEEIIKVTLVTKPREVKSE